MNEFSLSILVFQTIFGGSKSLRALHQQHIASLYASRGSAETYTPYTPFPCSFITTGKSV